MRCPCCDANYGYVVGMISHFHYHHRLGEKFPDFDETLPDTILCPFCQDAELAFGEIWMGGVNHAKAMDRVWESHLRSCNSYAAALLSGVVP